MVFFGLRKLAKEHGLRIAGGVAYGEMQGFAATLSEGLGYKQIAFTTRFETPTRQKALEELVRQRDLHGDFRIEQLQFTRDRIHVVFWDNVGTIKRLRGFLNWFLPLLEQYGAGKADICTCCGAPIEEGTWLLQDGTAALHLHDACAETVLQQTREHNEQIKQSTRGSYLTGALGALLGAVIGAAVWALLFSLNILAAAAGLLICWLSDVLYTLFRGKKGKGKAAILIVAVILGILLGTFAGSMFAVVSALNSVPDIIQSYTLADIPGYLLVLLILQADFRMRVILDVVLGLCLGVGGACALLRKTRRESGYQKAYVLK